MMAGETDYPGIDYGLGETNMDRETGIRFGVIPMNALNEWAWESFETDYGPATCGNCGNEAVEYDDEKHGEYPEIRGCADYACEECGRLFGSDDAFGDEPVGHTLDDGEYQGFVDSSNDVWVCKSPYFTNAQFCSPCAPGAGHLSSPCPAGPKTYCFNHDWFDGGKAPYPVFRVDNGEPVPPPEAP